MEPDHFEKTRKDYHDNKTNQDTTSVKTFHILSPERIKNSLIDQQQKDDVDVTKSAEIPALQKAFKSYFRQEIHKKQLNQELKPDLDYRAHDIARFITNSQK